MQQVVQTETGQGEGGEEYVNVLRGGAGCTYKQGCCTYHKYREIQSRGVVKKALNAVRAKHAQPRHDQYRRGHRYHGLDCEGEDEDQEHDESKVGPHQPVEEVHFPGYMFGEGKRSIHYVDNGWRHLWQSI